MNFDPEKHHRRSIRLKGYDYSRAGMYFITICVQNRLHLFGAVNYYEHIIQNDHSFERISKYIQNNPSEWGNDKFNG